MIKNMMISLRKSQSRSIIEPLVVFLFKLKTGNCNKMLAPILQLRNEHAVSDYSNSIIKLINKLILKKHPNKEFQIVLQPPRSELWKLKLLEATCRRFLIKHFIYIEY